MWSRDTLNMKGHGLILSFAYETKQIPGRPKSNDLIRDLTVVADPEGVGDALFI